MSRARAPRRPAATSCEQPRVAIVAGFWRRDRGRLGRLKVEEEGGGVDDGDIDRREAAFIGEGEGDAEQVADEAGDALDEAAGVGGDELGGRGGGGEAVVEHGVEEQRVGLGEQRGVDDDTLGEGGVLLEAQAAGEERIADEPDGKVLAAVEVEAGEAVELVEEVVAQALCVVEDDDGDDAAVVDERDEGAL